MQLLTSVHNILFLCRRLNILMYLNDNPTFIKDFLVYDLG